ncbi:scaffold protein [EBPR podovirus 1]|nr:scaffold protein [EBPR podovirus 1]
MQEAQEQQTSSPADASSEAPETVTEELQQSEQQEAAEKPEEGDEGDDQGGEEKLHEKPKRSARERINELTKRAHEAEREVQRLREASERKPAESTEKPIPDRFGSYDEYVEALADWKADQRVAESFKRRDAERSQAAEARAAEAKAQAWAERQSEFREATPDYDAVVGKSAVQIAPHVVDTLLDSESGPELAYHLAKRPETVKRINALSPLSAARELGRIEATLSNPAAPQFKPASKAPAPITPARSSAPAAVDLASANMDQYIAARRKQGATFRRR